MKTKVLYLALAMVFFSGVSMMAQNRGGGGADFQARQQKMIDDLKKELKLDKDQSKKFDEVYKKAQEKMMKMRQEVGDDRTGMREKMTELNKQRTADIKKILKPKQVKAYDAYLKKQAEARANRGRGGRGGGGGGR